MLIINAYNPLYLGAGLEIGRPHILEMAGKNKFELPSKKKMAGEIL
jgi:hypothetical protein